MKLLTLHQRLIDIVMEADPEQKLDFGDLVNIANHLVEAGVSLPDESVHRCTEKCWVNDEGEPLTEDNLEQALLDAAVQVGPR